MPQFVFYDILFHLAALTFLSLVYGTRLIRHTDNQVPISAYPAHRVFPADV